jgi:hypothetical protein
MRPHLLVTLVTIYHAHPAKAEVLLTFMTANFNLQYFFFTAFWSFELLVMKSMPTQSLFFIATVYRPPDPYTAFLMEFPEFPEFLLDLVVMADNNIHILVTNIHVEKSTDHSKRLSEPSLTQWVLSNMSPDLLNATVIPWI